MLCNAIVINIIVYFHEGYNRINIYVLGRLCRHLCTINSKINGTPISKLHSILAVANLLAHNNL